MARLLTANGAPIGHTAAGTTDTFVRADGPVAGWAQRARGGVQWHDAHETHPTQFDPWEIDGNQLVGAPTVRDSSTQGVANFPIDPDTLEPYSPFFVSHRLAWFDCGQDDEWESEMSWEVPDTLHALMQVSIVFGVDLDATNAESGMLYAYDASIFGGIGYWHNVPVTPDVASCFEPSYYVQPTPSGAAAMTAPAVGRNWWRVVLTGGTMQAFFNGVARHTPIARPSFTDGRTTVGIHAIVLSIRPDDNFVGDAAVWVPAISDPDATAIVPAFHWRSLT